MVYAKVIGIDARGYEIMHGLVYDEKGLIEKVAYYKSLGYRVVVE